MVDKRTNYARDIMAQVHEAYSASVKVFATEIPLSVRAAEIASEGTSIYDYDPKGKVSQAYMELTKEVMSYGN